jgi:hypothetical protein
MKPAHNKPCYWKTDGEWSLGYCLHTNHSFWVKMYKTSDYSGEYVLIHVDDFIYKPAKDIQDTEMVVIPEICEEINWTARTAFLINGVWKWLSWNHFGMNRLEAILKKEQELNAVSLIDAKNCLSK